MRIIAPRNLVYSLALLAAISVQPKRVEACEFVCWLVISSIIISGASVGTLVAVDEHVNGEDGVRFQGLSIDGFVERQREEFSISILPGTTRTYSRAVETEIIILNGRTSEINLGAGLSIPLATYPASLNADIGIEISRNFQRSIGTTTTETHSVTFDPNQVCDDFILTIYDRVAVGDLTYMEADDEISNRLALVVGSNISLTPNCD